MEDNSKNTVIRSISFEKGLFEKIEKTRGLVPRSTYISEVLKKSIGSEDPASLHKED